MKKQDTILRKIKKLMSKADSLKEIGNLEEATSFMQAAQTLLLKHNLELSQVKDFILTGKIKHLEDDDRIPFGNVKSDGKWEVSLLACLARYNFCECVYNSYHKTATLIGTTENITVVTYLFEVSRDAIKRIANASYNTLRAKVKEESSVWAENEIDAYHGLYNNGVPKVESSNIKRVVGEFNIEQKKYKYVMHSPEKAKLISYRKVWIRSFLVGAVVGVTTKLKEERSYAMQYGQNASSTTALVKVSDNAISDYVKQAFPKLRLSGRKTTYSDHGAALAGQKAGKGLNLNKGVTTTSNQKSVTKKLK